MVAAAPYVIDDARGIGAGRLYDTGRGYPGAVFAPGRDLVHGWCCTLAEAPLGELDAFEGDEYERITVRCTDGTDSARVSLDRAARRAPRAGRRELDGASVTCEFVASPPEEHA